MEDVLEDLSGRPERCCDACTCETPHRSKPAIEPTENK